jgi:flagellar assembly protein FliH
MLDSKPKIVPFDYALVEGQAPMSDWSSFAAGNASTERESPGQKEDQLSARLKQMDREKATLLRAHALEIAAARSEGYEAGRKQQHEEYEQGLGRARETLLLAVEGFKASRDQYFARVEREVVTLSLAIAARILNRETRMDPLLLSGAVRVALGQLSESTEVQLHIPAPEEALWSEMLRLLPGVSSPAVVVPDQSMQTGECRIETPLGSVDLGIRAQLEEIERGFFDLLEQRKKASHAAIA